MVILRATRKLRTIPHDRIDPDVDSDTALGDWYVNRFVIDRRPLLLMVSSLSLLPIVVPARDVRSLPSRLAQLVADRLTRIQVPSSLIQQEVEAMNPVVVARTTDRSVVGTMVDFARMASYILPEWGWGDTDLVALDGQLGTSPCRVSRPAGKAFFPDQRTSELLEARWRDSRDCADHMDATEMVRLVQEASGEQDVEVVQLLPAEIRYQDQTLHPLRIVRKGRRYLVEVVEFPGEWWMGEFDGGTLVVWGSYGTLAEAAGGRTEESDGLHG